MQTPVESALTRFVYLNGEFIPQDEAKVSVLDRGFLFGDSIYEVIPVYQGVPFRLPEHLARLRSCLDSIALTTPCSDEDWTKIITQLIAHNGHGNQSLYLQVTRGTTDLRSHTIPPNITPTVLVMSSLLSTPTLEHIETPQTLSAICVNDFRWGHCDIKTTSLLANVMLSQQAQHAGVDEAILLKDGQLTEGAASNIFVVKDGVVHTPPKGPNLLGGITRDLLIEIMAQHHIEYRQEPVSRQALVDADEIWVTSSTKEIAPIVSLDGTPVNNGLPGPLWKTVAKHYIAFKRALCTPTHSK
ncbi:MAG: D-amino acid aminotransferase [Gammaproteobacteria bacterium]|nr:D-amino acid aminotransferase [Gammaproteobacteria bacterium]